MNKSTSWGNVAGWYDELLEGEGTYQKEVVLPNLLRLMDIKKGQTILDVACGQGSFSREFAKAGAVVRAADVSPELIELAKEKGGGVEYQTAPAHKLDFVTDKSVDVATIVLALGNIENYQDVLRECARVLKKDGKLFVVVIHPAFRVPQESAWGFDPDASIGAGEKGVQYRRVNRYLSDLRKEIIMDPGKSASRKTITFHRSLQTYFKAFKKAGFCVVGLEEWVSHKKSDSGPRAQAENRARSEFPLFACLELRVV